MTPPWFGQLETLLQAGFDPDRPAHGGAELAITNTDGDVVFRRPLARHARLDDDCVWIRPILGDGPHFDLDDCRRRGLPTTIAVTTTPTTITFDLADGARATIGPAGADLVAIIDRWDTFVLTELSAEDEAALADLDTDSGPSP